MDLDDAARRIFRHHAALLLLVVTAGALVAGALSFSQPAHYAASARIVVDATDPKSPVEAQAIADGVRAIAASPGQVAIALRDVGAERSARTTAAHVTVGSVGSSRIVTITVDDRDARVARDLANALADQVVKARSGSGGNAPAIKAAEGRVQTLSGVLAEVDGQLNRALDSLSQATTATQIASATATSGSLRDQRDQAAGQLIAAQQQRDQLVSNDLARPRPAVLDAAPLPTSTQPSSLPLDVTLGALGGLLLGLAVAVGIETISPSAAGKEAIGGQVDAPVLGKVDANLPHHADLRPLAYRVALACNAAEVRTCTFVAGSAAVDLDWLTDLARRLGAAQPLEVGGVADPIAKADPSSNPRTTSNGSGSASRRQRGQAASSVLIAAPKADVAAASGATRTGLDLWAADLQAFDPIGGQPGGGLVLVVTDPSKRIDLQEATELVGLHARPLLGVVTVSRRRRRGLRQGDGATT